MFQRWRREFVEFFFTKGSALTVAIAFIVGQQFTRIVDSVTKDLLMPLLNPLVPKGSFQDLKIDYFDDDEDVFGPHVGVDDTVEVHRRESLRCVCEDLADLVRQQLHAFHECFAVQAEMFKNKAETPRRRSGKEIGEERIANLNDVRVS